MGKAMESRDKPAKQTHRREQAMGDLRNAVSAAAVGRAVLFDDPTNMLGAIVASSLANMDATTLVLHTEGARAERTYYFKGEKKKARMKNRQMQTLDENNSRTKYLRIKFWCTTLASGKLCTPVFSLTVDGLKSMQRLKVCLLPCSCAFCLDSHPAFSPTPASRPRQRRRSYRVWHPLPDSCRAQEEGKAQEEGVFEGRSDSARA